MTSQQQQNVILPLTDFDQTTLKSCPLFEKFKNHYRNYRVTIPFSMEFTEVATLKPIGTDIAFRFPSAVKISRSHHCICVSDHKIKFFDLTTFEFLGAFNVQFGCSSLLIEENFDNQHNDAIYLGFYQRSTIKYRVKDLIQFGDQAQYLWKTTKGHSYGMEIRQVNNKKQLFRFDINKKVMDIIDTVDGSTMYEIRLDGLACVLDIIFINNTRMMVSDLFSNHCYIFEEKNQNEWISSQIIESAYNFSFGQPLGMVFDRNGGHVFLSDYDNKRIIVFNERGDAIFCFTSNSTTLFPFGLDFDERTGLLYIADQQNHSIRIFK